MSFFIMFVFAILLPTQALAGLGVAEVNGLGMLFCGWALLAVGLVAGGRVVWALAQMELARKGRKELLAAWAEKDQAGKALLWNSRASVMGELAKVKQELEATEKRAEWAMNGLKADQEKMMKANRGWMAAWMKAKKEARVAKAELVKLKVEFEKVVDEGADQYGEMEAELEQVKAELTQTKAELAKVKAKLGWTETELSLVQGEKALVEAERKALLMERWGEVKASLNI